MFHFIIGVIAGLFVGYAFGIRRGSINGNVDGYVDGVEDAAAGVAGEPPSPRMAILMEELEKARKDANSSLV